MQTPIAGFFLADTADYYPDDYSISECVRVGRDLALALLADGAGE